MKMKTRIISLSILAMLTVCLLTVTAASAINPTDAPNKLVGDSLSIHADSTRAYRGQSVRFSGRLTNDYGDGLSGYYGYLTDNGRYMSGPNFGTTSGGNWWESVTFYSTGWHYVAVHCDGMSTGVSVYVY
jgi:hypothetical protein